jgi:glutamyl-tRNA reductase
MSFIVVGLNHRTVPLPLLERASVPSGGLPKALRDLAGREHLAEVAILSTCNRTEVYAVVEDESARSMLLDLLAQDRGVDRESLERDTYWLTDSEAVRHLYRVASSLDSMVVGEAEIVGQVREAYRAATEEQRTGPVLNRLFHTSLRVGKRVRSETGIGDSSLSVPRVAVKLAEGVFGTLDGRRALVLGAGEMSELVIEHLKTRGVAEVRIANRTPERARLLAERVGGRAVSFYALEDELCEADVVVSSTGAGEWVVRSETVAAALGRREEPLFFIDIAVPRDVDPVVQTLGRVFLYDMDDLQAVVERNTDDRGEAAQKGEAMIGPAVVDFMSWLSSLHAVPLIRELRDGAERIRRHELARALQRMDLSPEEAEAVERMSRSLVNKLLHGPISELKALAEAGHHLESAEVRRRLLALEGLGVALHSHRSDPR